MFNIKRWTSFPIPCIVYPFICPIHLSIMIFMIVIFRFSTLLSVGIILWDKFNLCTQIYLYEFAVKLCQSVAVRFKMITYDDLLPMISIIWSLSSRFDQQTLQLEWSLFFLSTFFFHFFFIRIYAKDKNKIHVNIEKKSSSYFILSVVKNEVRIKFYVHPKKKKSWKNLKKRKNKTDHINILRQSYPASSSPSSFFFNSKDTEK